MSDEGNHVHRDLCPSQARSENVPAQFKMTASSHLPTGRRLHHLWATAFLLTSSKRAVLRAAGTCVASLRSFGQSERPSESEARALLRRMESHASRAHLAAKPCDSAFAAIASDQTEERRLACRIQHDRVASLRVAILSDIDRLLWMIFGWYFGEIPHPMLHIRGMKWKCAGTNTKWRRLQCNIAKHFVELGGDLALIHDLTHSGITQALQMRDDYGYIRPCYSDMDQTLLLGVTDRAVMFAMMKWPGADKKYGREFDQRMEKVAQLRSEWVRTLEPTLP